MKNKVKFALIYFVLTLSLVCVTLAKNIEVSQEKIPITELPSYTEIPDTTELPKETTSFSLSKFQNRSRIIGGWDALLGEFPYQTFLVIERTQSNGKPGYYQCGGSILSIRHILTAAHCIDKAVSVSAQLGSIHQRKGGLILGVQKFIMHPQYDPSTLNNDIAVLTLEKPIIFTQNIQPVLLPPLNSKPTEGDTMIVSGWGLTRENGVDAYELRFIDMKISSPAVCNQYFPSLSSTPLNHFCAGGIEGEDSCQGDSGGPIIYYDPLQKYGETLTHVHVVAGVVSAGHGCAKKDTPGVYSNVGYFIPWILNEMAKP